MLACQNLNLKINEKVIFRNLSFTCFRGCFLYLKGKNGSGKTSLLRMIAGIQKFDSCPGNSYECNSDLEPQNSKDGSLKDGFIEDQAENYDFRLQQNPMNKAPSKILINSIQIEKLEKPFVLYIGHKNGMKMELSVMDNLIFWAKVYDSELMLMSAINYWKLEDILDEKCYKLSVGNMRKASLARLMCCSSDIWLLDEVDVNLDEENRGLLFNAIKIKVESGGIVLFSSHSDFRGNPAIDLDCFK